MLAVTSVMLAAKINEHVFPLFSSVKFMLSKVHKLVIKKEDYLALEQSILVALDYDVQYSTSLFFLERFFTIFYLDKTDDLKASRIRHQARLFCLTA